MHTLSSLKKPGLLQALLISVLFILIPPGPVTADTGQMETIAIVPFETNSQTDISYITSGILTMLHSRLSWKDTLAVIEKKEVEKALSGLEEFSESSRVTALGEKTNADYVITGIITEFSGAYSIDTKFYNLKEKSFLTFYGQTKTIDKVISNVDVVAAKINKKVFNRTTLSYTRYENEKIITEEELRRMNPERMMPAQVPSEDRDKPWWKLW